MARRRKHPRNAAPRPDLSDWQGFRATRRPPRYRLLVGAALFAAISTVLLAQFKAGIGQLMFELWMFSLLALQLLAVVESDRHLRGGWRRAAPVASAFAIAAFLAFALEARPGAAFALAAAMLAIAFIPPAWHDRLLERVDAS